jgi:hypothetical protein
MQNQPFTGQPPGFQPGADCGSTGFAVQLLPLSHGISTISSAFSLMEGFQPLRIGWKEYLDLPEMGIFRLKAKVDTGARTSALHVDSLNVVETLPDGTEIAEVEIGIDRRRPERRITARVALLGRLKVKDSGGHPELRPYLETEIVLGPVHKRIRLTLTNRSGMLFRMILARKALEADFLVDTSRKYLLRSWHPRRHPR